MSFTLWEKLPGDLLKIKQRRWSALDHDVKLLIVGLAREQGFKCAHCSKNRNLEIEHDHYPEHGPGDKYTIYNVRGLVCRACNWHIGMHEAENRGEYNSWSDVFPRISDHQHESYFYAHECRVSPLLETMLEERLGSLNYWRRRNLLFKFDDWREWGGKRKKTYPWH
jgi:Recombination endonuclease VII